MKREMSSDEQIIGVLIDAEADDKTADLPRGRREPKSDRDRPKFPSANPTLESPAMRQFLAKVLTTAARLKVVNSFYAHWGWPSTAHRFAGHGG